ncbi:hypothetical protein OD90_0407 [Dokdonia sp. Hel_I_53]|nr:hypothetical protein OD90_0407 [Dokdonia sp. Hel_I_53]
MFTPGKIAFIVFFVIVFIVAIVWSYRKDLGIHKKQYKGSKWVLLGFIGFIILLFLIKILLKP